MAIKKFSKYIEEGSQPSSDFVAPKDSDKEVKGYQPRAKGEQDFANQHMVQKNDYYAVPGQDHVFNGSVKEVNIQPNNGEGVQKQGASDVNQPTGGGDSKRTADRSQGDMKPVNPIKEGLEDNDENPANRQHLCAKNVVHEQYGEGTCISEEHAEPDENGHVEWYDVMFKHGLERFVPVAEMKVTKAEAHMHASKKPKARKMDENREDTPMKVARLILGMGVRQSAPESEILKKIPFALKKLGLQNDKLIQRDPDFQGEVIDIFRGLKEDTQLDELSPELKQRAFDKRNDQLAKDQDDYDRAKAKAGGFDKYDKKSKLSKASDKLDKNKMFKKHDLYKKSLGHHADLDKHGQVRGSDKSAGQKFQDYKDDGGKLSYQQYKSRYLKQDFEVEGDLTEGKVMDALEKIVKNKSAGSVKFANGKTLKVDMTTANAMLNLHKKINDKNKAKMADQIEKSPEVFMKLMDVAFGGK
jgi:hypothetical protein